MGPMQGCLLSSLLFSSFLNDLFILFNFIKSGTLFLNCLGGGLSINRMRCQMFADDIVLLAFDPLILQNMINRLDK